MTAGNGATPKEVGRASMAIVVAMMLFFATSSGATPEASRIEPPSLVVLIHAGTDLAHPLIQQGLMSGVELASVELFQSQVQERLPQTPVLVIRRGDSVAIIPHAVQPGSWATMIHLGSPRVVAHVELLEAAAAQLRQALQDGRTDTVNELLARQFDAAPTGPAKSLAKPKSLWVMDEVESMLDGILNVKQGLSPVRRASSGPDGHDPFMNLKDEWVDGYEFHDRRDAYEAKALEANLDSIRESVRLLVDGGEYHAAAHMIMRLQGVGHYRARHPIPPGLRYYLKDPVDEKILAAYSFLMALP